ncbi:MAG: hypothetical protein AAB856_03020 [Patescibacteria group bacterium]
MSDFRKTYLETEISVTSREFIRTDPLGYLATRHRQINNAVRTDDVEAMAQLLPELNAVFGERNILFYWGSLVEERLNSVED